MRLSGTGWPSMQDRPCDAQTIQQNKREKLFWEEGGVERENFQ